MRTSTHVLPAATLMHMHIQGAVIAGERAAREICEELQLGM